MKDIVRQAVADAAQWLYQNRASATSCWLKGKRAEVILEVAAKAQKHDARARRADQLSQVTYLSLDATKLTPDQVRDFKRSWTSTPVDSRDQVIEELLLLGKPFSGSLHVGNLTIDRLNIRGPSYFTPARERMEQGYRASQASVASRHKKECADSAWWLLDTFPEWAREVLLRGSPSQIIREAAYRGYKPTVTIPRGLLEEAELALRQTGQDVSLAADLRKYL